MHAREAFKTRDPYMILAKHWPDFAHLREEPNFNHIIEAMRLHPASKESS